MLLSPQPEVPGGPGEPSPRTSEWPLLTLHPASCLRLPSLALPGKARLSFESLNGKMLLRKDAITVHSGHCHRYR